MSIFDRYAPFVQGYIYRSRWENLRAIQVAAGEAIFHTDDNVLLTASTASGKTEGPSSLLSPCSIRTRLPPWAASTSVR